MFIITIPIINYVLIQNFLPNKNGESICYKESGNTKLAIGENINVSINVDNIHIFDEKTGQRLN